MNHVDAAPQQHEAEPLGSRATEVVSEIKRRIAPVDEWLRTQARERPVLVLLGAIGIGYVAGRLIRRI